MRSKNIVPVGQGCKAVTLVTRNNPNFKEVRCCKHMEYYINVCHQCGDRFHSERPHTKTCSDRCRKRASRSKNDKFFQTVMAFANGAQS